MQSFTIHYALTDYSKKSPLCPLFPLLLRHRVKLAHNWRASADVPTKKTVAPPLQFLPNLWSRSAAVAVEGDCAWKHLSPEQPVADWTMLTHQPPPACPVSSSPKQDTSSQFTHCRYHRCCNQGLSLQYASVVAYLGWYQICTPTISFDTLVPGMTPSSAHYNHHFSTRSVCPSIQVCFSLTANSTSATE